jgi:two-component system cell cycle sensor histidine kinase PleC
VTRPPAAQQRGDERDVAAHSLAGEAGRPGSHRRDPLPFLGLAAAILVPAVILVTGAAELWPALGIGALMLAAAFAAAWRAAATEGARIRAEARLLRESIEATPVPFALYDGEDRLIAWNRSYQAIHTALATMTPPVRYADLLRATLGSTLPPEAFEAALADRLAAHRAVDGSAVDRLYPDGRWRRVTKQRTPSGGITGFAVDITELKRRETELERAMEAAQVANRAKSDFLASMSHELRTPLNAIIGFADILGSELFGPLGSPQYRDYARHIQHSGQHLLALIGDLLDIARAESNSFPIVETEFALAELVAEAVAMVEPRALTAGVTVVNSVRDGAVRLHADRVRLVQVLLNLLSNGVKFSDAGGMVRIEARPDAAGLEITVRDDGIGIAPEDLKHVAEPFFRAPQTPEHAREGTGLGLTLSKQFVELHGGTLAIESELGVGTLVRIRLPASRVIGEA